MTKLFLKILFAAGLLLASMAAPAFAKEQCYSNDALNTPIWLEFREYVVNNYNIKNASSNNQSVAFGHAFGRYAAAVNGVREREVGFACIELAIEQASARAEIQGLPGLDYRFFREASMGMQDQHVAKELGVNTSAPLYQFMNDFYGSPSPSSSHQPSPQSTYGDSYGETIPPAPGTLGGQGPYSPGYSSKECSRYANFSLGQAVSYISQAESLAVKFQNKYRENDDCTNENWNECRQILDTVDAAMRQIDQVFQGNLGVNRCRNCDLTAAYKAAKRIKYWERWLVARNYSSAWGTGNIASTIEGYLDNPVCKVEQPQFPPPPVWDQPNPSASASSNTGSVQGWGVDYGGVKTGVAEIKSSPATDGFTSYFQAPSSMLGDWTRYSTFSFSLKSWGGDYYSIEGAENVPQKGDISISSGNKVMAITIGDNHGGGFKQYDLSLRGGNWKFYGGAYSASDILNNVTSVSIRSEYGAGDDWSILRNVKVH